MEEFRIGEEVETSSYNEPMCWERGVITKIYPKLTLGSCKVYTIKIHATGEDKIRTDDRIKHWSSW